MGKQRRAAHGWADGTDLGNAKDQSYDRDGLTEAEESWENPIGRLGRAGLKNCRLGKTNQSRVETGVGRT